MGQTYCVDMHFDYTDKDKMTKDLQDFIKAKNGHGIDFSLEKYAAKNIYPDTLDNIMKIIFTDRGLEKTSDTEYNSSFDASYGWENVIFDTFDIMAPNLSDKSYIYLDTDEDSYELTVKNGKIISTTVESEPDDDDDVSS